MSEMIDQKKYMAYKAAYILINRTLASDLQERLTEYIFDASTKIAALEAENAVLREQLRWRIVANGELPEVFKGHAEAAFVLYKRYHEETCYRLGIGYYWAHGWEIEGKHAYVSYWMPAPEPPEVKG